MIRFQGIVLVEVYTKDEFILMLPIVLGLLLNQSVEMRDYQSDTTS